MKQKFVFIVQYGWILLLALLGIVTLATAPGEPRKSEEENRMLAGAPACSASAVLNGEFMTGVETWLSDAIVCRSGIVSLSNDLQAALSVETDDLQAGDRMMAALQEETLGTAAPEASAPQQTAQPQENQTEQSAPKTETVEGTAIEETTFWIRKNDGSVRDVYRFPVENVENAASVLNQFRAALPEDGHVIFSEVPVAQTGNSYQLHRDENEAWGSGVEEQLQKIVDPGVEIINASEVLLDPLERGEHVYFHADHHWTPLGAHAVYCAMMERLGVPPLPYDEYRYVTRPFRTDTIEVIEAIEPVESYLVQSLDQTVQVPYMRYSINGYLAYLGGTLGPWRLFQTGSHTGRTALLIGDSFSNTLLPFLLPHYDRVLMTDLRPTYYDAEKAGASIREYMDYYGVEDVYIMLCFATSINSAFFMDGRIIEHMD